MKNITVSTSLLLAALLLWSLSSVGAGMLYRYKNDSGNTVMARTVPPHIVPKGYEVLNAKGRVVEVVAPAMTAAEKQSRDDRLAKEAREEQERLDRLEADRILLRQYSAPDDAVALLTRRLGEVDIVIQSRTGSIEVEQKNIAQLEEKAADFQRNGKSVPKIVMNQISAAQSDIEVSRSIIEEKRRSRAALVEEFDQIITRLETLTGKKATDYKVSH